MYVLRRKSASLDSNPQRRLTNVLYYGTMQLGTPGQEITVCPDTGSAAIWTSADATPPAASGNINIGPAYNGFVSNASSSFQVRQPSRSCLLLLPCTSHAIHGLANNILHHCSILLAFG